MQKKIENLKSIIICVLLLFIILLRTCDNLSPKCEEKFIHDTVLVETHDTIWPKPTKIYLKPKNLTPVATYTLNELLPLPDSICSLKRVYSDSIADSNLVFYYDVETMGILTKLYPSYKLKVPYHITHTIDRTVTLEPKKTFKLYAGLELGGNSNQFNVAPFLALTNKKRGIYSINYNLTQKSINVGFGALIFQK